MELSISHAKFIQSGRSSLQALRNETYEEVREIDYVETPISYEEFFRTYLLPNRTCVLGKWATENWKSRKEWVTNDGCPALDWLKSSFGGASCPVANCNKEKFSSHTKSTMKFEEFIDYMKTCTTDKDLSERPCLYLKDWHFSRFFPDYHAYETPIFFQSDWLNEFCDQRDDEKDDYRFVYFGPTGSWTPFHTDVLHSYSWSANICGKKRWILFPPGEEDNFRSRLGTLPLDLTSRKLTDSTDGSKTPDLSRSLEVIQLPGEVIFVASGWHHQVFNMEDTISINHNWLNGCSVDLCWQHLVASLCSVQREISDCADMDGWHEQCQVILKAVTGSNFYDFFSLLHTIGKRRLLSLTGTSCGCTNAVDATNRNNTCCGHAIFDILQISKVLEKMLSTPEFRTLLPSRLSWDTATAFDKDIKAVLDKYLN